MLIGLLDAYRARSDCGQLALGRSVMSYCVFAMRKVVRFDVPILGDICVLALMCINAWPVLVASIYNLHFDFVLTCELNFCRCVARRMHTSAFNVRSAQTHINTEVKLSRI